MSYGLRILPAADADVVHTAAFFAQQSLDAALRFYDAIELTYQEIRDHPAHWPRYGFRHPRLKAVRKRSVLRFPSYLVFYQVDADMVEVIRVLHGARDIASLLE